MTALKDTFTSTGAKFFWHQEAMHGLRTGKPQCVTTHVMLTDVCNHRCAFCSVQHREGDSLHFEDVLAYLGILKRFGLKSVILSGGGNPILYKCKQTGKNFNDVVEAVHGMGLQIGLITNGMPLKRWQVIRATGDICPTTEFDIAEYAFRESWATVHPNTLDKLTWVRVSMSGLDHEEREVFVPDIDPEKTTLGFSYILHDIYDEPADKKHGKVSTQRDLITLNREACKPTEWGTERLPWLTEQFKLAAKAYRPKYIRLLPNCLEPLDIPHRCWQLQLVADEVNRDAGYEVAFVQNKPPAAPKACYLGYVHPVLNADGYVYPCDSCVLNEKAGHQFNQSWRVCHWSEVASLYESPVRSLIKEPGKQCPGCVFTTSCNILEGVVLGTAAITPPSQKPEHENFI